MNIESFADTLETTTESENNLVTENPLDKIDKGKKPLFLVHPSPINDVNTLARVLRNFHLKYVRFEDQVVFFQINTTKECYLELFRTRKPNSKDLVEFYNDSYDYFIQNHISNRLLNNSESGRMTQLRIVTEGILGSCFITEAPAGIVRGNLDKYLSIIDKGNWTIFHHDIFDKNNPKNGLDCPKFTASEMLSVISGSSMFDNDDGLLKEIKRRFETLSENGTAPMTLIDWFSEIDRKDLITNYLDSPFGLNIMVGPEELLMKEMIDTNNIINLWTAINFFISKWQMDGTSTDFHKLINDVFNSEDEKYKILKKVLYSDRSGTQQLIGLRSHARACREWVLFLPILLEIYRKNDDFTFEKLWKIADTYHKVEKKTDDSPLLKLYSDYVFGKDGDLNLTQAYTFIQKWFNDDVDKACKNITKTFEDIKSKITYQINENEVNTWAETNPNSMGFRTKSQEDFQITMMGMVYDIVSKKQSINGEHMVHILTTVDKLIKGAYYVDTDKSGYDTLKFAQTTIGEKLQNLCTKGNGSYTHKAPLVKALSKECKENFDEVYGGKQKNSKFKKEEIRLLRKMKKIADCGDIPLVFGFIDQEGNYKTYKEDDFMSMSWFHFESGIDKFYNGCLWEFSNNAAVGKASGMGFKNKREAYGKMVDYMESNKDKFNVNKMDLILWNQLLETWDENDNFDGNLQ
tara:strand:- start:783 stop:2852 length:2070 start_codon:yes stop_codon:yes gene_type:complete